MSQLFAGELRPGSHIIERVLVKRLGVSRTPLREALLQLEWEGFLRARPGRGYVVRELQEEEASALLELSGLLEPTALRMAGIPDEGTLDRLDALCDKKAGWLRDDEDLTAFIRLDDRWHGLLLRGCPNAELRDVLRLLRNRLYRYLCVARSVDDHLSSSIGEHRNVTRTLRMGDLEDAIRALSLHWRAAAKRVIADVTGSPHDVSGADGRRSPM